MPAAVERLKRRTEFLRVAAGRRKAAAPGLVLQVRETMDGMPAIAPRIGFTASRKVGNAVARNRARRRLRAAVQAVIPLHAAPGFDYVVIARQATLTRPFPALLADLEGALKRLGTWRAD
ncbi:MAG: ribonuclease P protein component [Alphaproteobacteria bacterium]